MDMIQDYVFMTDSDSDLHYTIADEKNIPVVRMPYTLDGKEYMDDNGRAGVEKDFQEHAGGRHAQYLPAAHGSVSGVF